MITLAYNQRIRLSTWADNASATVFTVRGYATEKGMNPDDYETMARANGHPLVGSIYSGGALVGDRATAARMLADELAAAQGAATLAQDERVQIDGRCYRVRVARGNAGRYPVNSDPIHFIPTANDAGA